MIPVVLCKVSQPSVQKRKSYDENFVTAKSARINYGATLNFTNFTYSYFEKGCQKNCARDNLETEVLWDMINALFLNSSCRTYFCFFL